MPSKAKPTVPNIGEINASVDVVQETPPDGEDVNLKDAEAVVNSIEEYSKAINAMAERS